MDIEIQRITFHVPSPSIPLIKRLVEIETSSDQLLSLYVLFRISAMVSLIKSLSFALRWRYSFRIAGAGLCTSLTRVPAQRGAER